MKNILTQMTPAMTAYLIGLIYRNTRASCTALAFLTDIAHDGLYRLLYSDFPYSRRMWEWFAQHLVGSGGYLVLDDTTWRRSAKRSEAVSFVWDSSSGKVVFGMSVVLLIWTDGKRRVPLGMRVWKKGSRSKVKLAKELLEIVCKNGLTPEYVLFDSWYAASELLNLLDDFGWRYIGGVRRNRLLDKVRIDELFRHRFGRQRGYLRQVSHKVLVVKHGKKYYLTNEISLITRLVREHYSTRQQIEETFRILKQEFAWGKCRARSRQAQTAHLHLGLYALCLVQKRAGEQTVYRFKQELFREAIPTQSQFVEAFTSSA